MEKIITKSFARLMGRGRHRGFITYDELRKSLGKRRGTQQNLEQAFFHIFDNKVSLVEKKSDYKVLKKKESTQSEEGKSTDKSDDPIRMYLREMGGVELLSREGEIAIAKRIEAGKDVMLNALSQSPITAQQFFEWNTKFQNDEILVREIIDIDTNYTEDEDAGSSAKQSKSDSGSSDEKSEETTDISEDEFNSIVFRHAVFPHVPNFENIQTGNKLPDSDLWPKKPNLSRKIVDEVLLKFGIK